MSSPNSAPTDQIRHVILLMLENRSFDQMLGCFQEKYPTELDGIDLTKPKRFNEDPTGRKFFQEASVDVQTDLDPRHDTEHVLAQINEDNGGFVKDFVDAFPNSTVQQRQ